MPKKEVITPSGMRPPFAPFSLCTRFGGLVYVAGQTAYNHDIGRAEGDIRQQTRTVLQRVKHILEEAGSSMENALSSSCYIDNLEDFPAFNEEYATHFPVPMPVRATTQVKLMSPGCLVEIFIVACIPD